MERGIPTILADTSEYRPFIRTAGCGPQKQSGTDSPHRAQLSYLIQFLCGGVIEVGWPDGEVTKVDGPGTFVLPPGTAYTTRTLVSGDLTYVHFTVDQNPLWRGVKPDFCFGLRSEEDRKMLQPSPEAVWGISLPRALPSLSQDRITVQLPAIVEDWLSDDRIRVWRAQDRFALLIRNIISDIMVGQSHKTELSAEARVARAESVAAQSLHLGFDVNHMARAAGYDRSYFSQLYKRIRGRSAKEFLAGLRVEEAKRLLTATDLTIRDIAAQLGYSEPMVLTRVFRRYVGQTPAAWRDDLRVVRGPDGAGPSSERGRARTPSPTGSA